MLSENNTNRVLALGAIAAALLIAFVWVPLDTDTGMIEKVRRQVTIGDSLAPTLAAMFIGVGGLLLALQSGTVRDGYVTIGNLVYLFKLLVILMVSFAIMRWAGPLAVSIFGAGDSYAALRTTAPWNLVGFFFGGTFMVAALISIIEGRLTYRAVTIGAVATCLLILLYDVPFDDLLLPPNGDV